MNYSNLVFASHGERFEFSQGGVVSGDCAFPYRDAIRHDFEYVGVRGGILRYAASD